MKKSILNKIVGGSVVIEGVKEDVVESIFEDVDVVEIDNNIFKFGNLLTEFENVIIECGDINDEVDDLPKSSVIIEKKVNGFKPINRIEANNDLLKGCIGFGSDWPVED